MLLFYATRDGQSRRIAERIAARLAEAGIGATALDLAEKLPAAGDLARACLLVVIASVRYGYPLPESERLISLYNALPDPPRLALASVNLTARKPNKNTAQTNPYLRKWIKRRKLNPALATAFAGCLDYPHYRWIDRQIIRLIMTMTGGETDPKAQIEYTNWGAVDAFAAQIIALIAG
ncbi:MAG: menaquinone-dependent protoporphyrinogen IX dehydrogenase [Alphaproteobacteria bacterium]|nr:menaquinone-dependent protoporphyrinogen IX dehydrogenase [Alphaproteobacteria bacterium]